MFRASEIQQYSAAMQHCNYARPRDNLQKFSGQPEPPPSLPSARPFTVSKQKRTKTTTNKPFPDILPHTYGRRPPPPKPSQALRRHIENTWLGEDEWNDGVCSSLPSPKNHTTTLTSFPPIRPILSAGDIYHARKARRFLRPDSDTDRSWWTWRRFRSSWAESRMSWRSHLCRRR